MFVTMVIAALARRRRSSALLGLVPAGPRPTRADIFGSVQVDYKLFLNLMGLVVFGALIWLSPRGRCARACVAAGGAVHGH